MMVKQRFFDLIEREWDTLRRDYGVGRIGLFGSCVRGEADDAGDLDVLVEFDEKTFDHYMGLKFFLEDHLGCKVDLVIAESIKPLLREQILREVEYAAGP